jgi:hypothetical protein
MKWNIITEEKTLQYNQVQYLKNTPASTCSKTGNGKTETDGDFFATVDPKNWKWLKKEEDSILVLEDTS